MKNNTLYATDTIEAFSSVDDFKSSTTSNTDTTKHRLENILEENKIDKDTNIYIVLSFPRSDMGKGTIVAHLMKYIEDSNAIKFDGLLNLSTSDLMGTLELDDFGLYRKFNPKKTFDINNYIIGGDLIIDFITDFGKGEGYDLTFRPHLSRYFVSTLAKK